MSIYEQYKTVDDAITIKFKANDDGTIPSFKIGRTSRNNTLWAKTFEATFRPYKNELADGTISESDANRLNIIVFITAILKGWENIQDSTGSNIEYNEENATKLFNDLPDLFQKLSFESSKMDNFLASNLKADAKN